VDLNRNAFRIVKSLTEEKRDAAPRSELGRIGGLIGGPARAAALSPAMRREIAVKASQARWKKPDTSQEK
jgi:hypothetical protein